MLVIFLCFDGVRFGVVIDEIVYYKDYVDMIFDKWFLDVIFMIVELMVNFFKVKSSFMGDF